MTTTFSRALFGLVFGASCLSAVTILDAQEPGKIPLQPKQKQRKTAPSAAPRKTPSAAHELPHIEDAPEEAAQRPQLEDDFAAPAAPQHNSAYEPFREMEEMQERMRKLTERLFDDAGFGATEDPFSGMPAPWTQPRVGAKGRAFSSPFGGNFPAFNDSTSYDIKDEGGKLVVSMWLPGTDRKHINLKVRPHELSVEARQRTEQNRDEDNQGQKSQGRFLSEFAVRRVVSLPAEVDPAKVTSDYKNGTLEVVLPKVAPGVEQQPPKAEAAPIPITGPRHNI